LARILVALAAAVLVFIATNPYPGVTIDSGEYLAVAEGVTDGHGFTMPYLSYDEPFRVLEPGERVTMTVFPPLYPILLAGFAEVADVAVLTSARMLGLAVFFAVVLLAQGLVWSDTRRWAAALAAGLLLFASDIVTAHAMAWSEAVMILAMLGTVAFVRRHLETGRRWDLVIAGVCACAAGLTRFAGVPVIFGAGAALLLTGEPLRKRLVKAAAFCSLSLIPIAAWFVRNGVVTGYASEKELGWHPPSIASLFQMADTFGGWVIPPGPAARVLGLVLLVLGLVFLARRARQVGQEPSAGLGRLCLIFGVLYLAFVVAARTLLDQNIPFDPRMLVPLQVLLLVGIASVTRPDGSRAQRVLTICIAILAVVSVGRGVHASATFSSLSVAGYTGDQWLRSETMAFAEDLPRDVVIITNTPDPLWLWHGTSPLFIPPRSNLYSGKANANYSAQLEELLAATGCRDAVVVFFNRPNRKPPREIDPLIVYELGLTKTEEFEDGEVYTVDEPECRSLSYRHNEPKG
jgi:4-amino-4-deoxy-L-arabinose transferase-like glycosyltransferase